MARLPVISGKELIKILTKDFGWGPEAEGSHATLTNDVSFITVPLHPELDAGPLRAILNDARIEREAFLKRHEEGNESSCVASRGRSHPSVSEFIDKE